MLDELCANLVTAGVFRIQSCDLHSDVLAHLFYSIVYNTGLNVNQNADSAACVDVGNNNTVLLYNLFETTDVHVLTNDGDLGRQSLFHGQSLVCCPLLFHECVHVCCGGSQSLCCNLCNVSLELSVLCNEVSLSINLNNNCLLLVLGHSGCYDTLSCDTACLLLCAGKSFLS